GRSARRFDACGCVLRLGSSVPRLGERKNRGKVVRRRAGCVTNMNTRRDFLRTLAAGALVLPLGCQRSGTRDLRTEETMMKSSVEQGGHDGSRMPVLFVGHGSPMNVIEDNRWSRGFAALQGEVPRPRA